MPEEINRATGLLLRYCSEQLTLDEERDLFLLASADQDAFNQLMEAEALRDALSSEENRNRLRNILEAGNAAVGIPLPTAASLIEQGWTLVEEPGVLHLSRLGPVPLESVSILRGLTSPYVLDLTYESVMEISALRELNNLMNLDLRGTGVVDISTLRELKNLETLSLAETKVTDVSALEDL